jgi:hypothetical protein
MLYINQGDAFTHVTDLVKGCGPASVRDGPEEVCCVLDIGQQ